jgi:hypothetical protein
MSTKSLKFLVAADIDRLMGMLPFLGAKAASFFRGKRGVAAGEAIPLKLLLENRRCRHGACRISDVILPDL